MQMHADCPRDSIVLLRMRMEIYNCEDVSCCEYCLVIALHNWQNGSKIETKVNVNRISIIQS